MSMEHPETYPSNQRGATRQTRRLPALRPKLKDIMDSVENPHNVEDRKAVKDQFLQFMHSNAGAQFRETTYLYWFENNYRSMLADYPEPGKEAPEERKAAAKAVREKTEAELTQRVEKAIETKAQMILLDWVLPNGKALRDCTGRDCRQMSGKMGDWLQKIAQRVKPTQLVGDVLKEADVRKLYPGGLEQSAA